MPFENLKHTKPDVTHLRVFGCGVYVLLSEEVHVNNSNPKSKLMTFLGYPQSTKGYLSMRGLNNVLFTAVQALFYETLFLKCPDMCCPRYTHVPPPVDAQGEYNIPPDDNENEDDGGADLYPAPPGRYVPYQAPLPPARPQGPPVSPPPPDLTTLSDSTPLGNNLWRDIQVQMPQGWAPYCTGRGRQRTPPPLPMAGPS